MRSIVVLIPALLALTACGNGTQGADTDTAEAEASGNIVGNSSSSKPAPAASETPVILESPMGTPTPEETAQ